MLYKDLTVSPEILQAVERMGFVEMTEIQEKAIPVMMSGKDVIAKAPTGTGKTCAFGIPVIEQLDKEAAWPQTVILAPTRELAQQIAEDLRDLLNRKMACVVLAGSEEKAAQTLADDLKKAGLPPLIKLQVLQ